MSVTDQNHNQCNEQFHTVLSSYDKVLVIGLGQVGLPAAKYLKDRGFDTYGYDISLEAVDRAKKAEIQQTADFSSEDFQAFIITISTHQPGDIFSSQTDGILSVANKLSKEATVDGALVSIESTVPKGTSRKVSELLNHRLHVVHAPHRWYALEEKEHGVNQPRVIGGVYNCCLKAGTQFYDGQPDVASPNEYNIDTTYRKDVSDESHIFRPNTVSNDLKYNVKPRQKSLNIPIHPVSSVEIAETTKIVENAHRYLQIAFAEELYLYCQENNMSFPELRDALNTKWNVNILEPREGIGGHCLPKDTKMFLQSTTKKARY